MNLTARCLRREHWTLDPGAWPRGGHTQGRWQLAGAGVSKASGGAGEVGPDCEGGDAAS